MLSHCRPFTHAVEYASRGAESCCVEAVATAVGGEQVVIQFLDIDQQRYTDWLGNKYMVYATNIAELFEAFARLFPRTVLKEVVFLVTLDGVTKRATAPLIPLNRELISTVARRLLRGFHGDGHTPA